MKEERTRNGVPWDQPSSSEQSGTVGPGTEMLTPEAYVLRQKSARMKLCAERVNRWLQLSGLDGTQFHRKGHEPARLFGQSANTERRKFRPTGAHMLLGPIGPSARYKGKAISCVACRTTISFLCVERCFNLKHRSGRSESQSSWTVRLVPYAAIFTNTTSAWRGFVLSSKDSSEEIPLGNSMSTDLPRWCGRRGSHRHRYRRRTMGARRSTWPPLVSGFAGLDRKGYGLQVLGPTEIAMASLTRGPATSNRPGCTAFTVTARRHRHRDKPGAGAAPASASRARPTRRSRPVRARRRARRWQAPSRRSARPAARPRRRH